MLKSSFKAACLRNFGLCALMFIAYQFPLVARATSLFTFDSNAQGWTNQATEPFLASFVAGQGYGGGGALAITASSPRDSFQIVHAEDLDWPVTPSYFTTLSFDVLLSGGVQLNLHTTGVQIRDSSNIESNVYLGASLVPLEGGWKRVVLAPLNLFDLPQSHDDIGINLHIGTTSPVANSLVVLVDNVGVTGTNPPIPEPSTLALVTVGGMCVIYALRRRR